MSFRRAVSVGVALWCVRLAFLMGGLEFGRGALLAFAFPVAAIWFADQIAASNANLMGISLTEVSARHVRVIGWAVLIGGAVALTVAALPSLFGGG